MPAADGDLIFTIALGSPGSAVHQTMARMLVSSLLEIGWTGAIAAIVGPGVTLGRVPANVREIRVPDADGRAALAWKYRSRSVLEAARYRRVLYLDCDSIVVGDLAPLIEGEWDVGYVPEYGTARSLTYFHTFLTDEEMAVEGVWGINAGTFAVRGSCFDELMEEWERVVALPPRRPAWREGTDQPAWNRVVLDTPLVAHAIPEGIVRLPFVARRAPPAGAPRVIHFAGVTPEQQLQAMCTQYFETFGVS